MTFTCTWTRTDSERFNTFTIYCTPGRSFNRLELVATARHFCRHLECE